MAISSRYCRSVRAIVKTVRTSDLSLRGGRRPTWQSREGTPDPYRPPLKQCWPPDLSLRGAKRRGNLGKALPFGTSHRKNGTHLRFVIARSEATWQSREGTPDLYRPPLKQCWPPDLSLRGAKRRGNLAVLARITEKLRRIRPPERQSRYETVLCLPFDQQRKYCPVHRHDKRPAKKIVRASGRPRGWLYKAILCPKISLF